MYRDKESRLPVLSLAARVATSTLSQVDQKKRSGFSQKRVAFYGCYACVPGKFDESVGKCLRLRSHGRSIHPPA